jgi:hypothetical protein
MTWKKNKIWRIQINSATNTLLNRIKLPLTVGFTWSLLLTLQRIGRIQKERREKEKILEADAQHLLIRPENSGGPHCHLHRQGTLDERHTQREHPEGRPSSNPSPLTASEIAASMKAVASDGYSIPVLRLGGGRALGDLQRALQRNWRQLIGSLNPINSDPGAAIIRREDLLP